MKKNDLLTAIETSGARSAWGKGVLMYAYDLVEESELDTFSATPELKSILLNGASSWQAYSYGGCSLIYDTDIAERLCNPSTLKRCNGGNWNPNREETWLDVQARALNQAYYLITKILRQEARAV